VEKQLNTNHAKSWQRDYAQSSQTQQKKKIVVKVRKNNWLTKGEKIIYSFLALLIVAAGMYIVSFSSSTDTLNRDVQSLEVQVQQMKVDNESLSFEVRELSKPERITKIARDNGLKIQDAQVKRAVHATE